MGSVAFAQSGVAWTATTRTHAGLITGIGSSQVEAQVALEIRLSTLPRPNAIDLFLKNWERLGRPVLMH